MVVTPNPEPPPEPQSGIVAVAVQRAIDRELDYRLPERLLGRVEVGSQVKVPLAKSTVNGFVVGFRDRSVHKLRDVIDLVVERPLIKPELMRLALWMSDYYVCPLSLVLPTLLPAPVRRRGLRFREVEFVRLVPDPPGEKLTKRQREVYERLAEEGDMPLASLLDLCGAGRGVVNRLEEKGYVAVGRKRVERDPNAGAVLLPSAPLTLSAAQAEALAQVRSSIDAAEPGVTLLYGVTGSGKTEVYLQAIAHTIGLGRSAIVMVPEIALTPQTIERFRARFGDRVAVLHSSLSDGERHDQWHRVATGELPIVVGPRSALFAPLDHLGLIVVDEEHETSYKQAESPMYHARDLAVMRGRLAGAAVLLGTATPSVETFHNTLVGKYALARLDERADDRNMPAVRIIDMRIEAEKAGKAHLFSQDLLDAIRRRLDRQEQTILFLNRRGYATQCLCPGCGFVAECDHCSVALTYSRRAEILRCNLCGESQAVPALCPGCGDPDLRTTGFGTEKIEAYLQRFFPYARVQRVDSDSMRGKDAHTRVMHAFRSGRIDVLVGTQMIAKGLHFPNVTLVGVVFADGALHMPDFRAAERTFQLLTQVAGRAGRGDVAGEVLVQTYTPFHPAIQAARELDYDRFFEEEIEHRRAQDFPPFTRLALLTVRGPDAARAEGELARFLEALRAAEPHPRLEVHGPMPAGIAKIKDLHRFQAILRAPAAKMITRPVRQALTGFKWAHQVKHAFDMDAVSMM